MTAVTAGRRMLFTALRYPSAGHIDLIPGKWDDALTRFKAYVESVD
jgi:hypothetical protein